MPLQQIVIEKEQAWALWEITESEDVLLKNWSLTETVPGNITNTRKRLEWITGRGLIMQLMRASGLMYQGIYKDEFGKPFMVGYNAHISLTHSFPYVAVVIDKIEPAGIDLEQPKQKLLRIAPRVLHASELVDAGESVVKHCIYWCAKETLIKIYGKKDLILSENLLVEPFTLASEGYIVGNIIVTGYKRIVNLFYRVYPNFVMVFNKH